MRVRASVDRGGMTRMLLVHDPMMDSVGDIMLGRTQPCKRWETRPAFPSAVPPDACARLRAR